MKPMQTTACANGARWEAGNSDARIPYHTIWATPQQSGPGAGIALFIDKSLGDMPHDPDSSIGEATAPSDILYRHPNGKALAVRLTVHNTSILLITVHAPHSVGEQKDFFDLLRSEIPAPAAGEHVILQGDFNLVETPAIDILPPSYSSPRAFNQALDSLYQLCEHLG